MQKTSVCTPIHIICDDLVVDMNLNKSNIRYKSLQFRISITLSTQYNWSNILLRVFKTLSHKIWIRYTGKVANAKQYNTVLPCSTFDHGDHLIVHNSRQHNEQYIKINLHTFSFFLQYPINPYNPTLCSPQIPVSNTLHSDISMSRMTLRFFIYD